ncbi:unnamed protein product [Didymodactylos carnosus]|uniref:ER membrane protein complex subunit 7 beta-sandwich domain-containing protein n=2 Tax=Didymodactylos carnosus TaxID=1234261 RepID=A0A814AUE4_9BILA|nr:unnamed protein product [Didymodactylos carnosus]CAF3698358.1 unnamed protein product [Didymodactylos carnosus]
MYNILFIWLTVFTVIVHSQSSHDSPAITSEGNGSYKIEGKILIPPGDNSLETTRVLIDDGQYIGIPQVDGTFVVCGIPSGSYVVSVVSPLHVFEPVRVDINVKGKIRARKVNHIQPGEVVTMKYPLNFETHGIPNYFQKREVYRLTDVIMNPMFLTLLVPLLLLLVLPKLASTDPEIQRDFQQASNMLQPNFNNPIPDISDVFANFLGGPKKSKPPQIQGGSGGGSSTSGSGGAVSAAPKRKTTDQTKRKS